MPDRFAFARRAYHFPSAISLRIALSKDRSATSRLSLPFCLGFASPFGLPTAGYLAPLGSFSSSFSRFIVSSFAPAYSCRHRW